MNKIDSVYSNELLKYPNWKYPKLSLKNDELLEKAFTLLLKDSKSNELPILLGKNENNEIIIKDLALSPHIIIKGTTGVGKSVLIQSIIVSLLLNQTPDKIKFIMIDPKQVELSDYNGIPHLLTPVITEMDKVLNALKWAIAEMESRFTLLKDSKVKNIVSYNKMMGYSALPYMVIVIDEISELFRDAWLKEESTPILANITQNARTVGIHLVISTSKPNLIPTEIITNIPSVVSMKTSGDEKLNIGQFFYTDLYTNSKIKLNTFLIPEEKISNTIIFIKEESEEVDNTTKVTEYKTKEEESKETPGTDSRSNDELFEEALRIVVNAQKGSASYLQRRLGIGYNRAAKLLEEMEELAVVGPANGSNPRDVYVNDADAFIAAMEYIPAEKILEDATESPVPTTFGELQRQANVQVKASTAVNDNDSNNTFEEKSDYVQPQKTEDFKYMTGVWICGVISFIVLWIYAIGQWGILLGLLFGWIPALIGSVILGFLWPLVLILIIIFFVANR